MARTLQTEAPMVMRRKRLEASRRRALARGFTLVELAVVVTIVGVLSVIAVIGYRKLILSSKLSEAENMVNAIRIAEEAYKAERGIYLNVGTTPCPAAATVGRKAQWDPTCNGGVTTWATLPVHSDGPVQFQYTAQAAVSGGTPPTLSFVNTASADLTRPWFVVTAEADLNGDLGLKTQVWTSSFGNQVFSNNVGE